jgi:dTDP-glucose pyrophosphorylase
MSQNLTLLIRAAGIGSRYGGIKQIDPVGPNGELIIHYSVYDAIRSGFNRVIFLIRHDIEQAFRERIGQAVEKSINVEYAFQEINMLPAGFTVPQGRVKPWGTGHAVLCCKSKIDGNFLDINADDFYGLESYQQMAKFLATATDSIPATYALPGYTMKNTLSENGFVSRGICQVDQDGYLTDLIEHKHVEEKDGKLQSLSEDGTTWTEVSYDDHVSMNMWGLTSNFITELETQFPKFLAEKVPQNPEKAEFLLPNIIGNMVREGRAKVKVLSTREKWFGVTYQEDRPKIIESIKKLIAEGKYPEKLFP